MPADPADICCSQFRTAASQLPSKGQDDDECWKVEHLTESTPSQVVLSFANCQASWGSPQLDN